MPCLNFSTLKKENTMFGLKPILNFHGWNSPPPTSATAPDYFWNAVPGGNTFGGNWKSSTREWESARSPPVSHLKVRGRIQLFVSTKTGSKDLTSTLLRTVQNTKTMVQMLKALARMGSVGRFEPQKLLYLNFSLVVTYLYHVISSYTVILVLTVCLIFLKKWKSSLVHYSRSKR